MSRDDMNFRAITYSLRTGPFPDTPWRDYEQNNKLDIGLKYICLEGKTQYNSQSRPSLYLLGWVVSQTID